MFNRLFTLARRLYKWVEDLAQHPWAVALLMFFAAIEAVFFPIPPDVQLIPMSVAKPKRALMYAALTTLASVAGAMVGYWLGATAMDTVGMAIVDMYQAHGKLAKVLAWYGEYDAWIVVIAGFTPLPYKLFTLSSGAAHIDFWGFIAASVVGRGARFFLVAGLIYALGDRAGAWIDRHFNTLTVALALIVAAVVILGLL